MASWIPIQGVHLSRQVEKEITEKLVAQDFEGDVRRRMEQDIGRVVENDMFSSKNFNSKSPLMGILWDIFGYFGIPHNIRYPNLMSCLVQVLWSLNRIISWTSYPGVDIRSESSLLGDPWTFAECSWGWRGVTRPKRRETEETGKVSALDQPSKMQSRWTFSEILLRYMEGAM